MSSSEVKLSGGKIVPFRTPERTTREENKGKQCTEDRNMEHVVTKRSGKAGMCEERNANTGYKYSRAQWCMAANNGDFFEWTI